MSGNPVTIDAREGGQRSIEFTSRMKERLETMGVPATVETLTVGDYMFYDRDDKLVLITRKGSDYCESIFSGHFREELEHCMNLINSYGEGYLFFLLEGVWANAIKPSGLAYFTREGTDKFTMRRTHSTAVSVHPNTLLSLQSAGAMYLTTGNDFETAGAIAAIYQRAQEGWPTSIGSAITRPELKWSDDSRVKSLMGLWPRLSEGKAIDLLTAFGSIPRIVEIATTTPDDLKQVAGIGPKMVSNLKEIFV